MIVQSLKVIIHENVILTGVLKEIPLPKLSWLRQFQFFWFGFKLFDDATVPNDS